MIDLALLPTERGDFDLTVEGGDLLGDDGTQTAVTVSLFTDRVAKPDDSLPEYFPGRAGDRRGWWGDLLEVAGRVNPIGSRLWLLFREKELPEVVSRAKEYADESLAWIKPLGGDYVVAATDVRPARLMLSISVASPGQERRTANWTAFLDYGQPYRVELKGE
jgi:phage gp46-like protein